jgi:hypothetical protein
MNVPGPRVLFPLALSAFTGLVIALSNHPTQVHAATSPAPLVGFHCANSYGCLSATNTGSGVGINSTSANNSGVAGATSALNAPYATVNLESIPLTAGVIGNDVSGLPSSGGGNTGVIGTSKYYLGMFGVTYNPINNGYGTDVTTFGAIPAVYGVDAGPNTGIDGSGNVGIAGRSLTRVGGLFLSRSGYGAVGRSFTGTGVLGVGRAAGAIALAATSLAGGPVFVGNNATSQVASIDSSGNLLLAGSVTTNDAAAFATKSSAGGRVVTYGARQSMATVEDFGQAQLRNGSASVQLDRAFAQLLDPRRPYLVFITAEGDNHGLYVVKKTTTGFVVRESSGGQSTLTLSYRVVGHAYGANEQRFAPAPALVARSTAAGTAPVATSLRDRSVHE